MNYLIVLGAGAVGGLVVTMLLIVVLPISSTVLFIGYLIAVVIGYFKLVQLSRIYGERGSNKQQARIRRPKVVLIHDSSAYRSLRRKA